MGTTPDSTAPGPYDGYVSETDSGYEVAAGGVVIATRDVYDDAVMILAEHCAERPRWLVTRRGVAVRID
jgi:hypothetical protein